MELRDETLQPLGGISALYVMILWKYDKQIPTPVNKSVKMI